MLEGDLHDKGDNLKLASATSTAFGIINKCKVRKQKLNEEIQPITDAEDVEQKELHLKIFETRIKKFYNSLNN